jgi:hypothetical protein
MEGVNMTRLFQLDKLIKYVESLDAYACERKWGQSDDEGKQNPDDPIWAFYSGQQYVLCQIRNMLFELEHGKHDIEEDD